VLIRLFLDRSPQTSVVKVLRLALVVADDGVIVMGSENGAIPARIHSPGSGSNRACAETRMRWEPIIEVTQIKGDGAHLNRIRPSRAGWTSKGETHECAFDIMVAGNRTIGADGPARIPVGNTVDIQSGSCTNAIGAALLAGQWANPDFDPAQ